MSFRPRWESFYQKLLRGKAYSPSGISGFVLSFFFQFKKLNPYMTTGLHECSISLDLLFQRILNIFFAAHLRLMSSKNYFNFRYYLDEYRSFTYQVQMTQSWLGSLDHLNMVLQSSFANLPDNVIMKSVAYSCFSIEVVNNT